MNKDKVNIRQENASFGFSFKTFDDLMKMKKIKDLKNWIPKKAFKKYNAQGLIPHYNINGTKAFKLNEVLAWIKDELIERHDGFQIISRFYSYKAGTKKPTEVPNVLINHAEDLEEISIFTPPCVYFLLYNIEIVYVGQSVNVPARIHQHTLNKDFNRVLYLPVVEENLLKVERFFIEQFQPKYNKENFVVNKRFMFKDISYDTLMNGGINDTENQEQKVCS